MSHNNCPAKTFLGAGVKTIVLFFTKGEPTQKIWYYQLDPGRSLGKTNPLNDEDLKEFYHKLMVLLILSALLCRERIKGGKVTGFKTFSV